ncbi:RNA-directed RNA polymerase, partial [ssRNA phage ESE020]
MDVSPDALYQALRNDLERGRPSSCDATFLEKCSLRDLDRSRDNLDLVFRVSLVRSILKKYVPPRRAKELEVRAICTFLESNDKCADWKDVTGKHLLDEMQLVAYRELPPLDWQVVLQDLKPGPGASVGSRGANSAFEKLFMNRMTTTSQALYHEYEQFLKTCSEAHIRAEEARKVLIGTACDVVPGSVLSTVPKNSDTDRTVCTEPNLNMLFQSALGTQFDRVLSTRYGYSKALQPERNQELARLGSLHGHVSTIDLKNASDTIALRLVQRVLPSDWYAAVLDCRSPSTRLPDGTNVSLNMVSSMGNGFTFNLMTYLFALMLRVLCKQKGYKFTGFARESLFGVFGDDIIVPSTLYQHVVEALELLGFTPNVSKSFSTGWFRESCGIDCFAGVNVRGVYCKSLSTLQDRMSLINRLNRWSVRSGISLPETIGALLPKGWKRFQVPPDESDVAGIHVPFSLTGRRKPVYWRWAPKVPKLAIIRWLRDSSGELLPHLVKGVSDNPDGIILAASLGWIASTGLTRRQRRVRYNLERAFTPGWDEGFTRWGGPSDFARWEGITYVTLTS